MTLSTQDSLNDIQIQKEIELEQEMLTDNFYKPHPLRFLHFSIFCFQNFFYGFIMTTFTILYQQLKIAYGYEYYLIQECFIFVIIGKLSVILFAAKIMDKFGFKKVNIFSIVILNFCCLLRCQIADSFNYVLAAMLIAGMSGVFLTSQYIKFSYNWFPVNERLIFLSILHMAMALGMSLGLLYPLLILSSDETDPNVIKLNIDAINKQYMFIGIVLLVATFFLKDKPPQGYGWQSEEGKLHTQTHPNAQKSIFWRVKNLLKLKQFRIYLIILSIKMNIMMISSSVYMILLQGLGYPHWIPGTLSIMQCFIAVASSIWYSKYFMDKKQKYYFTLFTLISMIFGNMKILVLLTKANCVYYSIFDLTENMFSGAISGVLYELIARNIIIEDFNFTNCIMVFFSFGVSLIGQYVANLILRIFTEIENASFVIFLTSAILYYVYFYYCYSLKQLILFNIIFFRTKIFNLNKYQSHDYFKNEVSVLKIRLQFNHFILQIIFMNCLGKTTAFILVLIFATVTYTQKIHIFEYAIQNDLTSSVYTIDKQEWQLRFWMMMHSKTPSSVNTILKFDNNSGNVTNFILDANDQLVINDQSNNTIQLTTMNQSSISVIEQFAQRKTDGDQWYAVVFHYTNSTFKIYISNASNSVPTHDYSASNIGTIDFGTSNPNCVLYFANVYIEDPYITSTNFQKIQYDQKLLGFFFFPFLSQNRHFVENVYDPQGLPLIIEEIAQLPSELFVKYNTNNVFSKMKIKFPNYWSHFAFYGVKMAINFALIFKIRMQSTTSTIQNQIKLYHRELVFGGTTILQNFSSILYIDSSINNTFNVITSQVTAFQYDASFNLSYLEEGVAKYSNIYSSYKTFDDTQYSMNFKYLQNIRANYTVSQGVQNLYKIYLNGGQNQILINNARFSSQDQHYCAFNIEGGDSYYFVVMIQEIIFYQDINLNIDQLYIDSEKTISLDCSLDDSLPYFQERFLINNNNVLSLKNCRRMNYLSRCDRLENCLRCQHGKCIRCSNGYYLKNGLCLICIYPFVVVNGNCIYGNLTTSSIYEPYINSTELSTVKNNVSFTYNSHIYVQIDVLNDQAILFQRFYVSFNRVTTATNYYTDFHNDMANHYLQSLSEDGFQFRVAVVRTTTWTSNVNNSSTFKCKTYLYQIEDQHFECVDVCPTGTHLKNSIYCVKNSMGCLTETQSQTYPYNIMCSSCDSGYVLYKDSSNTSGSCKSLTTTQSYTVIEKQKQLSDEIYDDNQYVYGLTTYPICDNTLSSYLVGSNCVNLNLEESKYCTILKSDGFCDTASNPETPPGVYIDTILDTIFFYFDGNYSDIQNLTCQSSVTFENNSYSTSMRDDICFWTAHISQNIQQTCLIADPDCTSCDSTNTNFCTSCATGNLIQLQYGFFCGQALPNCIVHIIFEGVTLCEQCESGYTLVQTDYDIKPIGYCILTLIQDCDVYEVINNTVVCSTSCANGYENTELTDPVCVEASQYVNQCKQYFGDINTGYQCIECQTGYDCITSDGLVDNVISQNIPCAFCLDQNSIVSNCYVYNSVLQCAQCYTTHYLQDPLNCVSNCSTVDPNDNTLCQSCITGTTLQNQECYITFPLCDLFSNVGCNTCNALATIFSDTDKLFKCQIQNPNCLTTSSTNINYCDQCQNGFRLFRHPGDYDLCPPEITNCLNYSTIDYYICSTCQANYRVFSQTNNYDICEPVIANCQTYSSTNKFTCDICQSGFRVFSQVNDYDLCVPIISNCQTYSNTDQFLCSTCTTNFRVFSQVNDYDLCEPIILDCQTYSTLSQYICQSCVTGYRSFVQANNYDLCVQDILNCQNYSTTNQLLCDQCIAEYRQFQQPSDFDICAKIIQNCEIESTLSQFLCDQCITGFRVFSKTGDYDLCSEIIQNCDIYSTIDWHLCQTCQVGFRLIQQLNDFDLCLEEIQNCSQYDQNDPTLCSSCIDQYELSADQYSCTQSQVPNNNEQSQQIVQDNQVDNSLCHQFIRNCKICHNERCSQCQENYYLYQNNCFPNCIISIESCNQCEALDQTKCVSCKDGKYLQDQKCLSPCQKSIFGSTCFVEQCKILDENCQICLQNDLQKCSKCKNLYQLDQNGKCQQNSFFIKEDFYSLKNCEDFCKACLTSQCLKCKMIHSEQFEECIMQKNSNLTQNLMTIIDCEENTICFNNNQLINQHCRNCLKTCVLEIEQDMNVFQIDSKNNLQFKRYLKNYKEYVFIYIEERPNQLQVEILNLYMKKFQIQLSRNDLVQSSYDCTPQTYYSFNEDNIFFNYRKMSENKSKVEGVAMGVFLSSFQFVFPSWLVIYVINSLQKIDILSYVGFTNMGGGTFYDFMNSFPESEVRIMAQEKEPQKEFQKQFKLSQYQLHYFNLINEASVLTLISLSISVGFVVLWTFLRNIRDTFANRVLLIFEAAKNKIVQYQYSLLGILQIHILPQISRFFIIHESIGIYQKILIISFDFFVSYLAIQRLINHFNYNNLEDRREKKYLTIFVTQKDRLKNFELLFNFYIALDQTLCLLKDSILFSFQFQYLNAIIAVASISALQLMYFLIQLRKYGGIMKKLLWNFFISEFLFLIFLILMCYASAKKNEKQFNNTFNIVYIALNLFKILETLTAVYTVKKIAQDKLSHLVVKKSSRRVMCRTTEQYKLDHDLQKIKKSDDLLNKKLARKIRFERNFITLQKSGFRQ